MERLVNDQIGHQGIAITLAITNPRQPCQTKTHGLGHSVPSCKFQLSPAAPPKPCKNFQPGLVVDGMLLIVIVA